MIAGGAAQNTARGAQYILPANSVVYLGGVGDDKYAAILHDAVKQAGLRVEYRVDPKEKTGRCGVVITGHDRSMCTDLAAANHYDLEHLKSPEVWKLVQNANFYYVGGYHFTVCPDAIMTLAQEAAEKDKVFFLSLSAPFIPQFFKDPVDKSAPYWDYVVGNETEALAYAESHGLETKDIKEIAKHLANLPKKNSKRARTAIITQGTLPTIVAVQGKDEIKEYPVRAIGKEEINDTNGAGDAWAGGFVAGLVQGKSLEECVDMGAWLASLSIRELGPSYVTPFVIVLFSLYHVILKFLSHGQYLFQRVNYKGCNYATKSPLHFLSFLLHPGTCTDKQFQIPIPKADLHSYIRLGYLVT